MKIGITGSTGFLGSYLTEFLIKNNFAICAFTRAADRIKKKRDNLEIFVGDLASKADCKDFIDKVDVIIHLAHLNSPLRSNKDVISDASLNLIPSLNLLEAIKESNKKPHLVYASSGGAVYGESIKRKPFCEITHCAPMSSYGIQKQTIENYIRMYSNYGFLTSTILRISNPYGVLLPANRKQGLIGVVLNRLLKEEKIQIFGNPDNTRDYLHLDDMCEAFKLALKPSKECEFYNIGSGKGYSVNEVLSLIESYTKIKMNKEIIETQETKKLCDWVVLDISKAKKELGWEPKIELEVGLKELCNKIIKERNYYLSH